MKTNKLLIIDLEATCWDNAPREYVHDNSEIIEIGICLYDTKTKTVLENKGLLVKPQQSKINSFCTKLTSITPDMTEDSPDLSSALAQIKKEYNPKNVCWGSWGYYDLAQLKRECLRKNIQNPFLDRNHINIKTLFALSQGLPKGVGIETALKHLNLTFEGRSHRGVDDTLNISRILQKIN